MIKNRDIIIVGQQAWDIDIGSNCKNIAMEFSKHNRVLYVNPPLDRITKIRHFKNKKIRKRINIINGKGEKLIKLNENLWVYYPDVLIESINWIRVHKMFVFFNKRNNRLFSASILKPIRKLEFSKYILFNDSDIFRSFYLKEFLNADLSIYYSRDNMIATSYWKRHGRTLEPQLIRKSDLCVANSEYLKSYCEEYNCNSYYVGQGCELELFVKSDSSATPDTLKQLKRPIIGYVGALTSDRLDINLIEYIAKASPDWNIVLIGPEDTVFKNSKLHLLTNVIFLGTKAPQDLPSYIGGFDVCINPQALNELTIGNYPRKIDEYLAMGKPVVATLTETMKSFEEFVLLASTYREFVSMIARALASDSNALHELRKEFAYSHSWESSANSILFHIEEYQNRLSLEVDL